MISYNEIVTEFKFQAFKKIDIDSNRPLEIVIIDDNKKDIELACELLSIDGLLKYNFHAFNRISDAMYHLTNSKKTDLILLDIMMPTKNGQAVLQELKNNDKTKNIPVIMHSSMNNYAYIKPLLAFQPHAFCAKTIDVEMFEHYLCNA